MGSLNKAYKIDKLNGIVYTPDFIVNRILNEIGYNNNNAVKRKILDPACGDGRFLEQVLKRIIKYSPKSELEENINNIYGWDIDEIAIKKCKENLDNIIKDFKLKINWNIEVTNSIKKKQRKNSLFYLENSEKFDYIVGNPPYIRIQHLDEKQRSYIQSNYEFCKNGSTDIYIAFFELCLNLLSENGICGLITPNTYFFTDTAKYLREYFAKNNNLIKVTNYGHIQIFENATTYSAITIFSNCSFDSFIYDQAVNKDIFQQLIVRSKNLNNMKVWNFNLKNEEVINGKKLKEICKIHVGLTTLLDKGFIFSINNINDNIVEANTYFKGKVKLEKRILKPIIKASTLKSSTQNINEYILFPYNLENDKYKIFDENFFQQNYPLAYNYLLSIKDLLDKRDNGKPNQTAWYAFGRTQSLDNSWGKKIIFSPMNFKPNFIYFENEKCTIYSGYFIKFEGNYTKLLEQLNSERMERFISTSSRDFRGGWKAYSKKIIEDFIIDMDKL